ncbi:2'-5' RNA ligase family protein [Streptomyces sp. NPDC087212]|uniref:2'-5' RNA ligase family protein n=1 Tax=Streptomyces sp. NPDC087212 TaxID=3365766 RepID=UPI0037FE9682
MADNTIDSSNGSGGSNGSNGSGGSGGFRAGLSGLVVPVPEADPVVGPWRDRLDPHAQAGVPAHVTVLFPFLDGSLVDDDVLAALTGEFARHACFDARFERCGRFPGLLYLAPTPDAPFRRLTEAVVARWPHIQPYGGKFGDPAPHLTLAQGQQDAVLDEAEAALRDALPVATRVRAVDLVVHDGTAWRHRASFALGT